jgi:hypothetical protein
VGSGAEIGKVSLCIKADYLALGQVFYQLGLVDLALFLHKL